MVTQQILVLFFLVRIQVAQQKKIAQAIFFCICTFPFIVHWKKWLTRYLVGERVLCINFRKSEKKERYINNPSE